MKTGRRKETLCRTFVWTVRVNVFACVPNNYDSPGCMAAEAAPYSRQPASMELELYLQMAWNGFSGEGTVLF